MKIISQKFSKFYNFPKFSELLKISSSLHGVRTRMIATLWRDYTVCKKEKRNLFLSQIVKPNQVMSTYPDLSHILERRIQAVKQLRIKYRETSSKKKNVYFSISGSETKLGSDHSQPCTQVCNIDRVQGVKNLGRNTGRHMSLFEKSKSTDTGTKLGL